MLVPKKMTAGLVFNAAGPLARKSRICAPMASVTQLLECWGRVATARTTLPKLPASGGQAALIGGI